VLFRFGDGRIFYRTIWWNDNTKKICLGLASNLAADAECRSRDGWTVRKAGQRGMGASPPLALTMTRGRLDHGYFRCPAARDTEPGKAAQEEKPVMTICSRITAIIRGR
jgi:hypothetical protein